MRLESWAETPISCQKEGSGKSLAKRAQEWWERWHLVHPLKEYTEMLLRGEKNSTGKLEFRLFFFSAK